MGYVEIKGDDEFVFKAMVMSYGDDGKEHLTINYKREYDNKLAVTLEAEADSGASMTASPTITFRQFKRKFKTFRVYLQGYVDDKGVCEG